MNNTNNKNNNGYSNILFTMCILLMLQSKMQQCLASFSSSAAYEPTPTYECGTMEIRTNCSDYHELQKCTVIMGHLSISIVAGGYTACNYNDYQFENLREITDFLLIHNINNLTSIKNMFPNLTVIRGQRLISNYALFMTKLSKLEKIEFRSLIAIQRGHVFINENENLCFTEGINWDRLTLSRGKNNIFLGDQSNCAYKVKCLGCKRDSCWSDEFCQKLESDSVISVQQDTNECHRLCLGGCYNRTREGCVVCKSWTDHGSCVDECPEDKYASKRYLRCYTREECIKKRKNYIFKNTCVTACPSGYSLNNNTNECEPCTTIYGCRTRCNGNSDSIVHVRNLMEAELISGCEIINGILHINIEEYIDEDELLELLKSVREITGFLKINRFPYLTSLRFLENLEKIHGRHLENKLYSLIIYNNKNITDLWIPKPGFEILNGGMYIHANDKLCNRHIREFRDLIKHDRSLDSVQTSDQEVLCSPAVLKLYVEATSYNTLKFAWPREPTLAQVEILYRPLTETELLTDKSELDTNVCSRINWKRELKFAHELGGDPALFYYNVRNLEPFTKYACLVKTFNGDNNAQEARSELEIVTTKYDIPRPPKMFIISKSSNSIEIEFMSDTEDGPQVVDFYVLEVYDKPDNKQLLDTRDYCAEPNLKYKDYRHEDYDDCCSRREEEKNDEMFLKQIRKDFSCSLDHSDYCHKKYSRNHAIKLSDAILRIRFESSARIYTITSLKYFHMYTIQLQACNDVGCSSSTILSTRTNYSETADQINNFSVCKTSNDEYTAHFSEPKQPNGYITSYALHFRAQDGINGSIDHHKLVCITRLEHERNNYVYIGHFNYSFTEAAIRVHSLGHNTFIGWSKINPCPKQQYINYIIHILLLLLLICLVFIIIWMIRKIRCYCENDIVARLCPFLCHKHRRGRSGDNEMLMQDVRYSRNNNQESVMFLNR